MSQYRIVEKTTMGTSTFQCQESQNDGINWVNIGRIHGTKASAVLYLNELNGVIPETKIHEYRSPNQKGPQPLWD